MSYLKSLLDPRWVVKRNKILKRDGYRCTVCGSKQDIQVHHQYYINNNPPWRYPDSALITLCGHCHYKYHTEHEVAIRGKKKKTPKPKTKIKKRIFKPIESKGYRYKKKDGTWIELPYSI